MIKETEIAWAAGFFDADGCTTSHTGRHFRPHVSLSQSDEDLEALTRFKAAVGCGGIAGPYPASKSGNPCWKFRAGYIDSLKIMDQLWPYLTRVKKRQYVGLLRRYKAAHGTRKRWVSAEAQFEQTRFRKLG